MSRNKYLASQRGFVLLELVGLMALMLLSGGLVYLQGEALWQQYYKQQVRFMGQLLAGDLRQLQYQALYKIDNVTRDVRTNANRDGYYLTEKGLATKTQLFSTYNCADVYFESRITKLEFSKNGAPSVNGYYRLRHKRLANFVYQIDVQPITGRVLAYDAQ